MPRITKKQRVRDLVAAKGWQMVGESEWHELRAALPDISERSLRDAEIDIAQPWRGVAQHTLDEMEISLRELSSVYESRPDLRRHCRDQVIAAKDRARLISQRPGVEESKRRMKAEMLEWMLVWLGDPSMFPAWVDVRLHVWRGSLGRSA
jgi:ATP/maltotriose-dependent transcriptional regulator MalT